MSVAEVLSRVWHDIVARQPALDTPGVALTGLLALGLVLVPIAWRMTRPVVTIAHEGAHAFAALVTGRKLTGIRVHSDTSGLTVSHGRTTGLGMVLTAFAGYPGPALLGLGAAWLLAHEHALAVLWLTVILLALMLVKIRNWYGLYAVGLAAVLVGGITWFTGDLVQSGVAYTGTWYLLIAASRPVLELHAVRRSGHPRTTDADVLARLTRLPGVVWVALFLLVSLACLVTGARWLLGAG